jgi:hypothetical protein
MCTASFFGFPAAVFAFEKEVVMQAEQKNTSTTSIFIIADFFISVANTFLENWNMDSLP